MRDAESLLGQVLSLGGKKITKEQVALVLPMSEISSIIEFVNLIINVQTGQAIEFINTLVEEGVDLEIFIKELVEFLRKLILIKVGVVKAEWLGLSSQVQKEADKILGDVITEKLAAMVRVFLKVKQELNNSEIVQLPIELAIIGLMNPENSARPIPQRGIPLRGTSLVNPVHNTENAQSMQRIKTAVDIETPATISTLADRLTDKQKDEDIGEINENSKDNSRLLEKIRGNWRKIVEVGYGKSRDLQFINVELVWPLRLVENVLEVGFKFDLHKSRFEKNSNSQYFAEAIKKIVGEETKVTAKVLKPSELAELEMAQEKEKSKNEKLSGIKVTEDNILETVLESFGGEVVG